MSARTIRSIIEGQEVVTAQKNVSVMEAARLMRQHNVGAIMVVEGDPAVAHLLIGPTTDIWSTAADTGRFVVHLCRYEHHRLADVFAGLAPSPGGPFATVDASDSEWGPLLGDLPDRLFCTYMTREEVGWSGLMVGTVDRVALTDEAEPLIHYRGRYRRLAD